MTKIGNSAFETCTNMTSIEIPSSVVNIGEKAFYDCKNLKIVIDNTKNNLKIGNDAFHECESVTYTKDATESTRSTEQQ